MMLTPAAKKFQLGSTSLKLTKNTRSSIDSFDIIVTGENADYIKQRGIDDDYCQKMILDYLKKFKKGKRADFEKVLLDKLPDVLSHDQKKDKIKNKFCRK